jgi:3-oxoadipate enol-lactonase
MPEIQLSPGVTQFYQDDDFTDPWGSPEAMFLLHGFAENSSAWNGWVPKLARHFRVIRPDMRGFGKSTPMAADYAWSVDVLGDDILKLADHLGIDRFHVVAAKVGGAIALRLAASHPDRVRTLTVTGATFISGKRPANRSASPALRRDEFEKQGCEAWARETMTGRLGSDCSPEMLEGWIQMMASTPKSTAAGFYSKVAGTNNSEDMPRITCPTLAIIIKDGGEGVAEAARERIKLIPRGELVVVPGDSYHVAATHPDACAQATIDFIERSAVKA